jgi:hypothetical protein
MKDAGRKRRCYRNRLFCCRQRIVDMNEDADDDSDDDDHRQNQSADTI